MNLFVYTSNPINWSDPLGLATIVIDPGHGDVTNKSDYKSLDCGAPGANNKYEKDVALALSLALGAELEKLGHKILYTRTGDDPRKQQYLQWRIDFSNKAKADYFISIHLNAPKKPNPKVNYFTVGYYSPKGGSLAACVANYVKQKGYSKCEAQYHTYPVLTDTKATAIYIEAGFITNPENAKILSDPAFLMELVEGIQEGINPTYWYLYL